MNKLEEIERSVAVPVLRPDLYILPQENFDWLIAEIERLKEQVETLQKFIREEAGTVHYRERAWKAETRVKELGEGLARAGVILEALNVSVKWELADEIKKEIQSVLPEIHRLLAEKEKAQR